MAFSDARNERDRADTGRNSGNHGNSGQRGTMGQQQDRRNMDAARNVGNRAPGVRGGAFGAGSSTAADHRVAIGNVRAPSIPAGGVAQGNYPTQDDAYSDYAKAVGKHATRGFLDKAFDWLGGGFYDPKEPMAGNPRSFAGGDFHSTTNPGSALGGLIGMFGGGVGSILGKVAGPAYTAAGLPEVWHGGYDQPDLRNGILGNTSNPMGGSMADIGGGHTYASGSGPGATGGGPSFAGGGTGNGGQYASLAQNGPMAPQPGQVTPATPLGASGQQPSTMGMGPMNLSVPGPSQYGLMLPGYQWPVR
jgi:hypothetical protein